MERTNGFLPVSRAEMEARGWGSVDFVYVSGDAYVDHPSFGAAIITRVLEDAGFRIGFWRSPITGARRRFGRLGGRGSVFWSARETSIRWWRIIPPRKKRRTDDYYSPGGRAGFVPTAR